LRPLTSEDSMMLSDQRFDLCAGPSKIGQDLLSSMTGNYTQYVVVVVW